jgi:hypothetical protein
LDHRYFACTPPPQLLLDDPTYLPVIQLDHKPPSAGSEIISGNETTNLACESFNSRAKH